MKNEFGTIEVRNMRGKLKLVGLAQTNRGQRYIKKAVTIDSPGMSAKDFKEKLALAFEKLSAEDA